MLEAGALDFRSPATGRPMLPPRPECRRVSLRGRIGVRNSRERPLIATHYHRAFDAFPHTLRDPRYFDGDAVERTSDRHSRWVVDRSVIVETQLAPSLRPAGEEVLALGGIMQRRHEHGRVHDRHLTL